jgi:uncharacterized protein YjbI with pentapeptide repeats
MKASIEGTSFVSAQMESAVFLQADLSHSDFTNAKCSAGENEKK